MKYEDWIKYEEDRLAEKNANFNSGSKTHSIEGSSFGPGAKIEAVYRERCLLEVLLQQQALIDALQAQLSTLQPHSLAAPF